MTLSGRERKIALVAALAVALLVADRYLITPALNSYASLSAQKTQLTQKLETSARLLERRQRMALKWQEMTESGLGADPARAEGNVLHAVRNWAEETGLTISSMRPDRGDGKDKLAQITVLASGTGTMQSVARFLWRVETTSLPLRIRHLQLGSRKEGADDLSLQLTLSTVYTMDATPGAAPIQADGAER